jgi:putative glutamine amidotransferase
MITKPIIGITPGFAGPSQTREFARLSNVLYCDTNYLNSVANEGAIPLILTHSEDPAMVQRLVDSIDGLLLTGGEDVNPLHYSATVAFPEFAVANERDGFEFALLKAMLPADKPVFAICRGHQVVNVALGGTLIQDIPAVVGSTHHFQSEPPPATVHEVRLEENSRASRALCDRVVRVNSYHHQAVDRLAPGLRAVGWSEEGIIEAVEHISHPYLVSVQWHPERLCVDGLPHRNLFRDFVLACGKR